MGNTLTLLSGGGTDGVSAANGARSSPIRRRVRLPRPSADHAPIFRFRTLIDFSQTVLAEPHFPYSVPHRRTHSHTFAPERLADLPFLSLEREPSRALHFSDDVGRAELQLRQLLRKRTPAHFVATPGHRQVQSLMRSLVVVDPTPLIESGLALRQIAKHPPLQYLGHQRPMKPLLLPLRLRMIRPAVQNLHPQPQQPHRQWCPGTLAIVSPRRAVVHQHRLRQTVAPKRLSQLLLNRFPLFIPAGLQHQRIARVIIQHCQRVAAPSGRQAEVSLEIHLPQFVRALSLETLERMTCPHIRQQSPTTQDLRDRARGRNLLCPAVLQPTTQFSASPRRMFCPQLHHLLLHRCARSIRTRLRPTRLICQSRNTLFSIAPQPLVRRLPRHPKATAQLRHVRSCSQSQFHQLPTRFQHRLHLPGHAQIPFLKEESQHTLQVLPMSPNACYLCPRSIHPPGERGARDFGAWQYDAGSVGPQITNASSPAPASAPVCCVAVSRAATLEIRWRPSAILTSRNHVRTHVSIFDVQIPVCARFEALAITMRRLSEAHMGLEAHATKMAGLHSLPGRSGRRGRRGPAGGRV